MQVFRRVRLDLEFSRPQPFYKLANSGLDDLRIICILKFFQNVIRHFFLSLRMRCEGEFAIPLRRLGKFGRDEFVRMALRNRAPIVPFVTLGTAEIFPIFAKVELAWWKRYSEWPFFPITPTFPLLPIPLPTRWHTEFMEPIHVEERYPAEAARDERLVRALGALVRGRMEQVLLGMRSRSLMEWVLRIMANLLRPDELGPAEAAYRAVAAVARLVPDAA